MEIAPDGTVTKYVYAGAQRIAAKDSRGLRFFHGDHLGSVSVVTDGAGKLIESSTHTPFGSVHRRDVAPSHSATESLRHSFTGQREDARTGLILFPARPYDPELGRFLQPDPTVQQPGDPQDLNRYAYARNNPIRLIDPTGLSFHSGIGSVDLNRSLRDLSRQNQQVFSDFTSGRSLPLPSSTSLPSLNATTTASMQDFSRTGSRFGTGPFDPFSFQGRVALSSRTTFREQTSPFGTTQTLLSSSFSQSSQFSLGPTPFQTSLADTRQALRDLSAQGTALLATSRDYAVQTARDLTAQVGSALFGDPARLLGWGGLALTAVGQPWAGAIFTATSIGMDFNRVGAAVGGAVGGEVAAALGHMAARRFGFSPIGGAIGIGVAGEYVGRQLGDYLERHITEWFP